MMGALPADLAPKPPKAMKIQRLPEAVIDQIAAGEAVERPASVVKELIENAIDAGARSIHVEYSAGGGRRIRVSDDGHGIRATEIRLAFARHATSKLRATQDLLALRTLGFRGEALASIAAVSQLSAITRHAEDELGTNLRLEGGEWGEIRRQAAPRGSILTVENLFYNTPARLKFLKRPATEGRLIARVVSRYAFAFPQIRFSCQQDERERFRTSGNDNRRDVLVQLLGLSVAQPLLELSEDSVSRHPGLRSGIHVDGFVSPPNLHRGDRNQMAIFVNERWIQNARINYAISQAYQGKLPPGRFPYAFLQITMPAETIDINVHPTKAEVRFQQPERVFAAVLYAIEKRLADGEGFEGKNEAQSPAAPGQWFTEAVGRLADPPPNRPRAIIAGEEATDTEETARAPRTLPPLRVIGQVGALYIIAEGPAGLYLIDQRAAHHRLVFEELRAERATGNIQGQPLSEMYSQRLSPEQAKALEAQLESLQNWGVELEAFGPEQFALRTLPRQCLRPHCVTEEILPALAVLSEHDEEALLRTLSAQAAYREGQLLTLESQQQLVRALERCPTPLESPMGASTLIHITREQLAREFRR